MASMAAVMNMVNERKHETANAVKPLAGPGSGGGGDNSNNTDNSATISANDFLTLLVTEMKNQDPTQAQDPNQYINQLVNVNSLEQLISINQNLKTALGENTTAMASATGAGVGTGSGKTSQPIRVGASAHAGPGRTTASPAAAGPAAGNPSSRVQGNLSVPGSTQTAERVAQSLGRRRPN